MFVKQTIRFAGLLSCNDLVDTIVKDSDVWNFAGFNILSILRKVAR